MAISGAARRGRAHRLFPLTPALSLRERVNRCQCLKQACAVDWHRRGEAVSLSPRERAGVRGKEASEFGKAQGSATGPRIMGVPSANLSPITVACHAMATRFEIVLHGDNAASLRAAGEEALGQVEQLEAQLSLFRASSEIAHLNARAAKGAVRVTPSLFALLQQARKLCEESSGAFDITVAPLVRCWGFMGGDGRFPRPDEVAEARAKVGMALVHLNPADLTVQFAREGVMLDLGAIGKGYAVERAAEVLREAGVTSALVHGGTSTVQALGPPPGEEFWKVAIETPSPVPGAPPTLLATVPLKEEAMSVSGVWGNSFEVEGRTYGHIIDPRTGEPAIGTVLAAVVLPSATETDALSTALLTVGTAGHDAIAKLRPGIRTLVVSESGGKLCVEAKGIEVRSAG
jgi:FAD:protein FMN transferase